MVVVVLTAVAPIELSFILRVANVIFKTAAVARFLLSSSLDEPG